MLYDYYKILKISRNASLEEIKQAYRAKAKLVHPDVNNSSKAHELFTIIKDAYDVLSDPQQRHQHNVKLNYADAVRAESYKQKNNYDAYKKYTAPPSSVNFNYQWESFRYEQKTDFEYYKKSPVIYNLFFISGMFVGFLILFTTIVGTLNHYWPVPFILLTLPGILLIIQGWKGIVGKRTILFRLFQFFKKQNSKK